MEKRFPETHHSLSPYELQRIRDKYYNSKVMLYVWNQLKKRSFEVPKKKKRAEENLEDGAQVKKKKSVILSKKDYMEMLRSMFKLMIQGLSNDRMKMIEKMF